MAASVKDVATRAGVSVGTVSNVLNHKAGVSGDVVQRVTDAIAELGFVRNDAARQLRAGRSRSIGLVLPDIGNPFFADVARGAEQRATAEGMSVLIVTSGGDAARETQVLELLHEQRVRGALVSPASEDLATLRRLSEAGMAVVLVDRDSGSSPLASVAVDDVAGGRVAAEHLIATGGRRIAFVGDIGGAQQVADRLEGARQAALAHGGVDLEVIDVLEMTVAQGREAGARLRALRPDERPNSILAANDLLAIGIMQDLASFGIRIPGDIALIGYDDIEFAAATAVPLSSVRQPAVALGYSAVDVLLGHGAERAQTRIRFVPELVARQSTLGT